MRPGHQLTVEQRLYYQALVDTFMYDLDKRLATKNHVFGYRPLAPRSTNAPFGWGIGQWLRFRAELRRQVESGRYGALVRTDLAAFFELIPHGRLDERLTSLGVKDSSSRELRAFLRGCMGKAHGLPQGPDPSGVLASAYLHPLDQELIGAGYGYVRYVDDIIVLAANSTEAKKALRLLEQEARRLDLMVQSAKTELVVGMADMQAAVNDDDEIAGIDYVIKRGPRTASNLAVHAAWIKAARGGMPARRYLKFLLGRLTDNKDPVAVSWCLARLGLLDYLAPTVCRYLSLFAHRPTVQTKIVTFLSSPDNISDWEELNLLRAVLSSPKASRAVLDRARVVASDRNAGGEVRRYALVLLGRHGDGSDHDFVARHCLETQSLASSGLLALQSASPKLRGRAVADVIARYPTIRHTAQKLKGRSQETWPTFR
jgi:hypothetical protein